MKRKWNRKMLRKLKYRLRQYNAAHQNFVFIGMMHPDDHSATKKNYRIERDRLFAFFEELEMRILEDNEL